MIAPTNPPRRERILLPGETHAPADPGNILAFELHGVRELTAPNGMVLVGLDMRRGPNRFVAAIPSPVFLEAVEAWLKRHDCRIESNRVSPVQNFRNALDSVGFSWKKNRSLDKVLKAMDEWWGKKAAQAEG